MVFCSDFCFVEGLQWLTGVLTSCVIECIGGHVSSMLVSKLACAAADNTFF